MLEVMRTLWPLMLKGAASALPILPASALAVVGSATSGVGWCAAQARGERHGEPLDEGAAVGKVGEEVGLRQLQDPAVGHLEPQRIAH